MTAQTKKILIIVGIFAAVVIGVMWYRKRKKAAPVPTGAASPNPVSSAIADIGAVKSAAAQYSVNNTAQIGNPATTPTPNTANSIAAVNAVPVTNTTPAPVVVVPAASVTATTGTPTPIAPGTGGTFTNISGKTYFSGFPAPYNGIEIKGVDLLPFNPTGANMANTLFVRRLLSGVPSSYITAVTITRNPDGSIAKGSYANISGMVQSMIGGTIAWVSDSNGNLIEGLW